MFIILEWNPMSIKFTMKKSKMAVNYFQSIYSVLIHEKTDSHNKTAEGKKNPL